MVCKYKCRKVYVFIWLIIICWILPYTNFIVCKYQGTKIVEGMVLNSALHKEDLNAIAFSNMKRLRMIKICNVHLPQGLSFLSNELRVMEWHDYPLTFMPRHFQPNNLVELIMPRSHIKQLPKEFSVSILLMQRPVFLA